MLALLHHGPDVLVCVCSGLATVIVLAALLASKK